MSSLFVTVACGVIVKLRSSLAGQALPGCDYRNLKRPQRQATELLAAKYHDSSMPALIMNFRWSLHLTGPEAGRCDKPQTKLKLRAGEAGRARGRRPLATPAA